jgi:hypothetical protein
MNWQETMCQLLQLQQTDKKNPRSPPPPPTVGTPISSVDSGSSSCCSVLNDEQCCSTRIVDLVLVVDNAKVHYGSVCDNQSNTRSCCGKLIMDDIATQQSSDEDEDEDDESSIGEEELSCLLEEMTWEEDEEEDNEGDDDDKKEDDVHSTHKLLHHSFPVTRLRRNIDWQVRKRRQRGRRRKKSIIGTKANTRSKFDTTHTDPHSTYWGSNSDSLINYDYSNSLDDMLHEEDSPNRKSQYNVVPPMRRRSIEFKGIVDSDEEEKEQEDHNR